ncbi:hypothetical protein MP228_003363 [Amoeboaphelidium protococcarum]|nr:hypothetical protein MP228_003363 [Amoeboaphelidium protococcarum]
MKTSASCPYLPRSAMHKDDETESDGVLNATAKPSSESRKGPGIWQNFRVWLAKQAPKSNSVSGPKLHKASKLFSKSAIIVKSSSYDVSGEEDGYDRLDMSNLERVPSWRKPVAVQPYNRLNQRRNSVYNSSSESLSSVKSTGARSQWADKIFGNQKEAVSYNQQSSTSNTQLHSNAGNSIKVKHHTSYSLSKLDNSQCRDGQINLRPKSKSDEIAIHASIQYSRRPQTPAFPQSQSLQQRKVSTHSVKETKTIESIQCTYTSSSQCLYSADASSDACSPGLQQDKPISRTSVSSVNSIFEDYKSKYELPVIEGMINQYVLVKQIGEGSFSKVWLVFDVETELYYACKCISKKKLRKMGMWKSGPDRKRKQTQDITLSSATDAPSSQSNCKAKVSQSTSISSQSAIAFDYMNFVKHEIAVLKKLSRHPNIATLVETLDDQKYDTLYMVFDLCEYGSVMKLIAKPQECVNQVTESAFSEKLSRRYFRDIVLGLEYLHSKNIVHRDLKPDNILLKADNHVVIGDFGISFSMSQVGNMSAGNGLLTPALTPPELITDASVNQAAPKQGDADFGVDIWSLGITLFAFLHGYAPFQGQSVSEMYNEIATLNVQTLWNYQLTAPCKDLLSRLLQKDPKQRITLSQVKVHPWTTNNGRDPLCNHDPDEDYCDGENPTGIARLQVSAHQDSFVSQHEVFNAVKPAMTMLDKLRLSKTNTAPIAPKDN